MNQPQTGKRIVSKGRYVCVQIARAFWWLDGLLFYLAAFLCMVIIVGFACGVLRNAPWPMIREIVTTQKVWMLLFSPGLIYLCFAVGERCLARGCEIEPVVPFIAWTRNSLPAPDSLVRASTQPMQEQTTLLRAVIDTQERHEEHLVRAVGKLVAGTEIDPLREGGYAAERHLPVPSDVCVVGIKDDEQKVKCGA